MTEPMQPQAETTPVFFIPQRALVIVAHADDIEFGMTGTVARWTAGGAQVTYCLVTDNSSGSNKPGEDLEALSRLREDEQRRAAAIVGVEDIRFLGYRDGVLEPTLELRRELTRLIRELKPEIVVTMDPTTILAVGDTYINHPDHRATGEAALYAIFPSAESRPIFPELLDEGLEPHKVQQVYLTLTNNVNHYVDISDYIELKREALRCHSSQIGEDEINMVIGWNEEDGVKIGAQYAESFRLLRISEEAQNAAMSETTPNQEAAS
jgi:LmbE family N-acetylglucosaminyl deacetylase